MYKPLRAIGILIICGFLGGFTLTRSQPGSATVPAIVAGSVYLQSNSVHAGITVSVGVASTQTREDGSFILANAPPGAQTARAAKAGFLAAQRENVPVLPGDLTTLPAVTLLGGDMDGDDDVDLLDLVPVAAAYGQCPAPEAQLDLTQDGCLNLLDLVMLGGNYGRKGPLPWEARPTPTATPTLVSATCDGQQATPSFTFYFGTVLVNGAAASPGTRIELYNPRGERVGCAVTTAAGIYPYTRAYGEDSSANPPIAGMRAGEAVTFKVNGAVATTLPSPVIWQDDKATHAVDLSASPGATATP